MFQRVAEYLKHHLTATGATVGLVVGLVMQLVDDLPLASTAGIPSSLILNLAVIALCSGLALQRGGATLGWYLTRSDWTLRDGFVFGWRALSTLLFVMTVVFTILEGWTNVFLWLLAMYSMYLLGLLIFEIIRSGESLPKLPKVLCAAARIKMAVGYRHAVYKFETSRFGRWLRV